jgi:acetyl-CoA carboxylase carboxyl transferase subunit beta
MNFGNLFKSMRKQSGQNEAPSHWRKCPQCLSIMYYKEVESKNNVCPKCSHHFRIGAKQRIEMLADKGSFIEKDSTLEPIDPLKFVDKKSYKKRLEENKAKTGGRTSSVISGSCTMGGLPTELVVFDFAYMGGSLGSVEGEKIVRAVNRAIKNRSGVVIVSASGGARMQESTYSLMQMSKTSAALYKLHQERLPYISVLTDPTMGGVSASFAMLGDIIMAEPNALIGFAGQRVIKQTIGADLPEGFQRAEFLLEHGLIDMVVDRNQMKESIVKFLKLFLKEPTPPTKEEPQKIPEAQEENTPPSA